MSDTPSVSWSLARSTKFPRPSRIMGRPARANTGIPASIRSRSGAARVEDLHQLPDGGRLATGDESARLPHRVLIAVAPGAGGADGSYRAQMLGHVAL